MTHRWIVALVAVALLPLACQFPTDPKEDSSSTSPQAVVAASTAGTVEISVSPAAATVQIGKSINLTYTVNYTRGSASDPLPTQLGLVTNLGNFGSAAGGPTQQTASLTFPSGCSACTASVSVSFYTGSTTGTANIAASVGGVTKAATVTVSKVTALFLQKVDPDVGPAGGGNQVRIFGQGFQSSPLPRVTFGSAQATVNSVVPDGASANILVTVPQSSQPVTTGSTVLVDVTVELAATDVTTQQTDTLKGGYTYTPGSGGGDQVPSIQRVETTAGGSSAGDNAGGYSVDIIGSGFVSPVEVKLGSGSSASSFNGIAIEASNLTFVSGTKVTILSMPPATPSQLNQSIDVLLVNTGSGLGTVAQAAFGYQSPDIVVDIDPTELPYYDFASGATVSVRGISLGQSNRYRLEFGGQNQGTCPSGNCTISGPDSRGTYSLQLASVAQVTVSSCSPPSGAVKITDTVTTETATGPTFSYTADVPGISSLSTATSPAAGGGTTTLSGSFSEHEIDAGNVQVLVDGRVASFSGSPSTSSITIAIPAFTGSFDEASCTSGGVSGTKLEPKQVDVEVLYTSTGCNALKSKSFTYTPADESCVVASQPPTSAFTWSLDPNNNLKVDFIDKSSGASSGDWFYGDGQSDTCSSFPCDVSHTYAGAGRYTVTLRVSSPGGTDSFSQTVTVGEAPIASFSAPQQGAVNSPISFSNDSTGIDSSTTCRWSFGDGTTVNDCSPTVQHTYTQQGSYTVQLTVINGLGSDSLSSQIAILPPPPP